MVRQLRQLNDRNYISIFFQLIIVYTLFVATIILSLTEASSDDNFQSDWSFYDKLKQQLPPWSSDHLNLNNFRSSLVIGKYSLPPETIRITKTVAVRVPQFIPLPHNVPYPVVVPVSKPFPVEVQKIININNDNNQNALPNAFNEPRLNYGIQAQYDWHQNQHEFSSYGNAGDVNRDFQNFGHIGEWNTHNQFLPPTNAPYDSYQQPVLN